MSVTVHQVPYAGGTNGQVYPITDRRLIDFISSGASGVVVGCNVTNPSDNNLQISSGWGIAKGCIFTIATETVVATLAGSGSHFGELILTIDTSNSTAAWSTTVVDGPTPLTEDDLTASDGTYQMLFATYDVDTVSISNLQEEFATISPAGSLPFDFGIDANGNYGYYKTGENVVTPFDPWCIAVPQGYALTSAGAVSQISGGSVSVASAYGAFIVANIGGLNYTTATRTNGNGSISVIDYDGTITHTNAAAVTLDASSYFVICRRNASSQAALSLSFS